MKPGRPQFHVKAKYIGVLSEQFIIKYALDDKGNLLRRDGKFVFTVQQRQNNSNNESSDYEDDFFFNEPKTNS